MLTCHDRMRIVLGCTPLPAASRLLLATMALSCTTRDVCWPTVPTLVRQTGLSAPRIRRLIREFEEQGLLTPDPPPSRPVAPVWRIEFGVIDRLSAPPPSPTHPVH